MVEGKGGTVLILEDDPGTAKLQQRRLERAGYAVVGVGTAEEALSAIQRGVLDLILMDYRLSGDRTGLDVHAQLKAAGRDLPVIMVTGFSDEATVIRALRAGVRDFVTKSPEYLDYLPEAVERVLKLVRTEYQLAQSEARLAGIISSARDAILTVDADLRITLFNAAAEQIFRCPAAQAVGRPVSLLLPATADGTFSLFGQSGEKTHLCGNWFELRGERADGEEFPLEASVSSAEVSGQRFSIVIVRDITERKRSERTLIRISKAVESTSDAIGMADMSGQAVYHNQAFLKLYGYTPEDLNALGGPRALFAGPDIAEQVLSAIQDGRSWSGEVELRTQRGQTVSALLRADCIRDDSGQRIGLIGVCTDITEKKKLEAQFLRAQRMESIGTLAGGIAHDLNNVLTPVMMAVELLAEFLPEHARQSLLEPLQTSAQRGAEMVKQILSFARGVEGRWIDLQLKHVIRDVETMLRHTLPKSIELNTSVPKHLATVSGDATQLYQVLMNLCVNARDAMPHGGRLTISAENASLDEHYTRMNTEAKPGPHVVLTVADTGTGIPSEVLDKIFDPFFTTKEHGKGTGLGLSTSLGIVKSHGGFLTVGSEVGKGTRFVVYLPALPTTELKQAGEARAPLPVGRGELVLVADDEASVREITKATLEAHGYRVLSARDGAEAAALYLQHQGEVGAVLSDMMMPVMDGPATVRALQKIAPHVPIIAVSGQKNSGKPGGIADLGVRAFLQKPYTADKLLTTLRRVLDGDGEPNGAAVARPGAAYDRHDGERSAVCAEAM